MNTDITAPPARIKWDILAGIVVIHLGALAAFWTFTWPAFWLFVGLQFLTGLGITVGYHRLLTHRSFQVPKWLEYTLTVCGVLALQGGPLKWVSTHRVHHAFSDRANDPHSPTRGFWWAHMLWLFVWDDLTDVHEKYIRFVPDLNRDPIHRWLERASTPISFALGGLLFLAGGWPFLIWGYFVRTVFVYHGTWLVNSASHLWGDQTYDTNEGSRNNWWVALFSFGEGWHNNHHAYPHSAAHGLRWWEVDLSYLLIRFFGAMKWAKRIRLPQGGPARLPSAAPTPVKVLRPLRIPVPSLTV